MAIQNSSEILIDLTCPKCNAQMEIDSSGQKANCAYCGNSMLIKATHREITDEEATRIINERIEESKERARERVKTQKGIGNNYKKQAGLSDLTIKGFIWFYAFLSMVCAFITFLSSTAGKISSAICVFLTVYISIKGVKDLGVRITLWTMAVFLIVVEAFAIFIS